MTLLNSEAYGDLARVSTSAPKRTPGKFSKIFITGKRRPGQDVGKLQAMYEIKDDAPDTEYLVHNAESISFIPYFIKRFWEKSIAIKGTNGKPDSSKLVAFSWDDTVPKIDDECKFQYLIAGLLINPETKKAIMHQRDYEEAEIKKGDPVLIYFKCGGMKFNGGMNFVSLLADKTKSLPPLSNNQEFERNVVTPRRFISVAKVGTAKSDYGDKDVFIFNTYIQLPDKAVEQVMNSASGLISEFEKQFDRTASVRSGSSSSSTKTQTENPSFDSSVNSKDKENSTEPSKEKETMEPFDLGL